MQLRDIAEKHGDQFVAAVETELRKLAAEQPDFKYRTAPTDQFNESTCSYNGRCIDDEGRPIGPECSGCIFGQALQRLGWDDKVELAIMDDIVKLMSEVAGVHLFRLGNWSRVQTTQDNGYTWAEAVAELDKGAGGDDPE